MKAKIVAIFEALQFRELNGVTAAAIVRTQA